MSVTKCKHQFWNRYEDIKSGKRFNICVACRFKVELTPLNLLRTNDIQNAKVTKVAQINSRYASAV
ncbi:hypothetical protein ACFL3D_05640 [Candidatus Omnitrophota bacterium]